MDCPLSENKKWEDITKLSKSKKFNFDQIDNLIIKTNFSKFENEILNYFRLTFFKKEISERVFQLTKEVIFINSSNYTAWEVRRRCIIKLEKDLDKEKVFNEKMIINYPKNYQVWFHRKQLIKYILKRDKINIDFKKEFMFLMSVLKMDYKNYHCWAYRYWFCDYQNYWGEELEFTEKLIEIDLRNNSAWNHRFQTYKKDVKLNECNFNKELEFAKLRLFKASDNESVWNYIKGFITENINFLIEHNLKNKYLQWVINLCKSIDEKKENRHCVSFYAELILNLSDRNNLCSEIIPLWEKLRDELDVIRKKYWDFRIKNLNIYK